jgi:uncharacterized delta-60 repeat protein
MPRRPTRPPGLEELHARAVPAAGDLDAAFGSSGVAVLADVPVVAVALQPGGKVVAVGSAGGDFVVARYNPDGSVDTSFNGNGQRVVDLGGTDAAAAVAVLADGRVVVAGSTTAAGDSDVAVVRLNPDGTPDGTFNPATPGRVVIDLGGTDSAAGVAVQPDGRIVAAGGGGPDGDFAVVRLTTAGTPDGTFNGAGFQFVDFGDPARANAVAVQPDGGIVLAGSTGPDVGVARLTALGALDAGFDGDGRLVLDGGGAAAAATAVAVQADGRIVVAGGNGADMVAYRLLPGTGAPDGSFGTAGRADVDVSGADAAAGVAVQPDGKIVLVGGTGAADVAAARLGANGALDPSFGTGGVAAFDFGGSDRAAAVALTPAGRIVIGGSVGGDGFLARLIGAAPGGGPPAAAPAPPVTVSGPSGGTVQQFTPDPVTGEFGPTPGATFSGGSEFAGTFARPATADVNGDGIPDTVLVTGPGEPVRVGVISGADNATLLVAPFDPFGGDFTGGGFVAAGDMDGDGRAEFVVTPDEGGGPRVAVFSLTAGGSVTVRANFFGIDDPDFRGGARAAVGDVNADGRADLVVAAGFGGGPRAAVFGGPSVLAGGPARLVNDFFAFPGPDAVTLRNGAFVAAGDVTGDGFADLIFGGGPGGGPRVFVLSGALVAGGNVAAAQAGPVANFFVAGNSEDRGGVRVGVTNADGDGRADLVVGSGDFTSAQVRVYPGADLLSTGEPTNFQDLAPFGGAFLADGVYVG